MKIAVVQMNSGQDKAQNIDRALDAIEKASQNGATFIALPEYFSYRGKIDKKSDVPESLKGAMVRLFCQKAKTLQVSLVLGSIYEKTSKGLYNTAVFINAKGCVVASYRKQNLFDAHLGKTHVKESDIFQLGKKTVVVSLGSFHMGFAICFDVRFPQVFEKAWKKGANLFCVPSCFSYDTGKAHWETLLRARAIENLSFVVAPNQIGKNAEGIMCWGHSMIIGPWGEILAEASQDKEEVIYADIDSREVSRTRKMFPSNPVI